MDESILDTIKEMLGVDSEYDAFDTEIISYINNAFFTLSQLGIGPDKGFFIFDNSAKWSDYVDSESNFKSIQTYIKIKVQLLFDPPSSSSVMEAFNKQLEEITWRLLIETEVK